MQDLNSKFNNMRNTYLRDAGFYRANGSPRGGAWTGGLKYGGPLIIFATIFGSLTEVASADPCDRPSVAAQNGVSLLSGSAIAALLSRIPYGGPIGAITFAYSVYPSVAPYILQAEGDVVNTYSGTPMVPPANPNDYRRNYD